MFVEVTATGVRVGDAGNLRGLAVRVEAGADATAGLVALGTPDPSGEHVWLRVDALRELALGSVAPDEHDDWRDGFDAMITYARSKGWTSDDGRSVRAHVEHA